MAGIIIQARTGSTRLPGKVLMPFGSGTVLDFIINRLFRSRLADKIIVATTTNSNDDVLQRHCEKTGILCYRGSENDVLQRYIDAAEQYNISTIIRVCSDNPFIDPEYIDQLIAAFNREPADYYSFTFSNGLPAIMSSIGFFGELSQLAALKSIKQKKAQAIYSEHVTQYLYKHPESYSIKYLPIPAELETTPIRLTIDTETDYNTILEAGKLINFDVTATAVGIYRKIVSRPDILKKMKSQIQKNPKV